MNFTLFVNPEHEANAPLARRQAEHGEQVRLAREGGFDGVVTGHHLCTTPAVWLPPMPTLARLAADAEGMALGTCMLLLPLFHPLHVAQEAALLDVLSGGRLVLGVAPGWQQSEYAAVGVDYGSRIGRFVEAVELIRRLWTGEEVSFAGRHFQVEGLRLAIRPAGQPRPRMWFGGSTPPAVERAARLADTALGDSWVCSAHLTKDVVIPQAARFHEALAALGKPRPAEFPALRNIVVAPDRATALREAGPYLEASYRVFGQQGLFTRIVGAGKEQLDLEELLAGRVVIGAPEECAEELAAFARATGADRLVCRVQWMGMEQRLVLRTIELLGERVLPLLRRELG
ncbi:MAG: LLM class flavin-dependent oxidoreductase [Chloroflexi bacterium]|nr:LLM class flavin-dependent oxidoreductase [Chloroflexota bacterium]